MSQVMVEISYWIVGIPVLIFSEVVAWVIINKYLNRFPNATLAMQIDALAKKLAKKPGNKGRAKKIIEAVKDIKDNGET